MIGFVCFIYRQIWLGWFCACSQGPCQVTYGTVLSCPANTVLLQMPTTSGFNNFRHLSPRFLSLWTQCDIDGPFRAEHATISYSLLDNQWWGSV